MWIDSHKGTGNGEATIDASLLTSGTLDAARLPGALANVDTKAEVLAAAGLNVITTTGTAIDYIATPAVPLALVDGAVIALIMHVDNAVNCTLNVSGTGAKGILFNNSKDSVGYTYAGMFGPGFSVNYFVYSVYLSGWVLFGSRILVDADMPGPSRASAIALKAPLASPTFTGAVTIPSTIQTGPLQFTTTQTSAGVTISNDWRGSAGQLTRNVPTGGTIDNSVNGVAQTSTGVKGILFPVDNTGISASEYGIARYSGSVGLGFYCPSGGSHAFFSANVLVGYFGTYGLNIGGTHSALSSLYQIYKSASGIITNAPAGYSTRAQGNAVAVAGATWVTVASVSGITQGLIIALVTGMGSIQMGWDGTTLAKLAGVDTLVVAGSAGGTEVAFRVSGGNLQASNGTGASKNVSNPFSVTH